MTQWHNEKNNHLLGYPHDARLLIVNADDFGMCNSTNEAIIRTLQEGVVRSTTLMAPCPWAYHAMHFLENHPEVPFGVHLTAICESACYRWGPVTPREKVRSLVDGAGYFYNFQQMEEFLAQVKLDQLETEFRAQIEIVLGAGLKPTHLDWHALHINTREDISDLMIRLAREYGMALRVMGRSVIEKLQHQGFPTIDRDFLDSFNIDPAHKADQYAQLLHELPPGLNEWAVHPGFDNAELQAIEPAGNHVRQTDYDFFTSPLTKELIIAEGIILLDYRSLQAVWSNK